jgi:hypothetical protein
MDLIGWNWQGLISGCYKLSGFECDEFEKLNVAFEL